MTTDILFKQQGAWGIVTLNRPKALNALTWNMVKAFYDQLSVWEANDTIGAVMVKGEGERAFCAGGDIRWLHDEAKKDPDSACQFFHDEYRNNALIYRFAKPYVAFIDGIVMGGGVGVSVHGDFRVAGDNTLFAMPETGIGLFPDVGGGHFMPRLHDGVGLYYALTGARAKAADCMAAGIATHYTQSDRHEEIEASLLKLDLKDHAHGDIETVLDAYAKDPGHAAVNDLRQEIAAHFSAPKSFDDLMAGLKGETEFQTATRKTLERMSPTSLKLTFEQMRRGHELDFNDVMRMEYRAVNRVMHGADFFEGVRAQIIDKDRAPKWSPDTISAVSDADVAAYFEGLGERELELP